MFEEFDRFSDPDGLYFAYPEAKANLAFFDGSVRQEETADANPGWNPNKPDEVWLKDISRSTLSRSPRMARVKTPSTASATAGPATA